MSDPQNENAIGLSGLEKLAAGYDGECLKIEDLVSAFEADMDLVRRQHIVALKRQACVIANRKAELQSAIECAPQLFVKPRTFTLNGVKLGYTTSPGSIVWDDDAQVVEKIRKLRAEEFSLLVNTIEEPRKSALKSLSPEDLKKLGCRIEGDGDVVILSRVAGDVEKLISKLIEKLVAAMVSEPKL